MTDKEDKEGKILIGPWDKPTKKNSEETKKWIKERYDRALEKKNIQLKMQEKVYQRLVQIFIEKNLKILLQ